MTGSPAVPDRAVPPPAAPGTDPAALWSAAVETLAERPFFAWLRFLQLDRIDGDTAWVTARPGHREVQAIATPQRLEPVAQELTRLRGTRTRVSFRAPPSGDTAPGTPAPGTLDSPSTTTRPDQGGARFSGGAPVGLDVPSSGGTSGGGFDRRAAMQVPLVRQVLDIFPDASLIEAREETEHDTPPEVASDTDALDDPDEDTE